MLFDTLTASFIVSSFSIVDIALTRSKRFNPSASYFNSRPISIAGFYHEGHEDLEELIYKTNLLIPSFSTFSLKFISKPTPIFESFI